MPKFPPARIERLRKWGFLRYYLPIYSDIVTNHFPTCHYIDGFAGPGKEVVEGKEILGSPLIALGVKHPFTNYTFIESDQDRFQSLQDALNDPKYHGLQTACIRKGGAEVQKSVMIASLRGKFDALLPQVLSTIPKDTPIFAFIDPYGIEEIPWDTTIVPFTTRRSELLINFSIMGVIRNPEIHPELLNALYGDGSWRNCRTPDDYLKLYIKKLEQHWKYVLVTPPIRNEKGVDMYCLIFTTRIDIAKNLWKTDVLPRVKKIWEEKDREALLPQQRGHFSLS